MKSFAVLALFAALAARVAAMTVDTPASLVQCLPALITWHDGTAPYFPTVIPGGQATAAPLKSFPQTNDMSLTWIVDIPAGQSVTLAVRDSTGEQVFSSPLIIQAGDAGCLNGSSTTGATTGTPATTAPGGTSRTAAPTGGATTTGATTGTSSKTGTGTSTGTSPASTTNAAVRGSSMNALGFAGVMGLLGAALF